MSIQEQQWRDEDEAQGQPQLLTDAKLAEIERQTNGLIDPPLYGSITAYAKNVLRLLASHRALQRIIEAHELCHDRHGQVGAREFADSCAAEQRKEFGCAPDADEVKRLQAELERVRAENERLWQGVKAGKRCIERLVQ